MKLLRGYSQSSPKFCLIDTDPYVIEVYLSQAIERERYRGDSSLHRSLKTKYPVVQVKNRKLVEGLKTQLSSHSSWLDNQSLQQCYKFINRVGCICHIKGKLCYYSCAWMADLAVWKIRKVLLKVSYAERTYTLERNPEYQKERKRMMAFIMNMWRIRPVLDMLLFIWKLYMYLEDSDREREGKAAEGRTKPLIEGNLFLCI